MKDSEKSAAARTALRERYKAPEWALLEEVRNGTGYSRQERYADAVALNLWPSRGMELHGVEVKVSRTDWLRELKNPAKAETICGYCDRWWVAATDGVVRTGELPPTWGLLTLTDDGKLRVATEAPKLEAKPLDRSFVAAILRRCAEREATLRRECVAPEEVTARVQEHIAAERASWEADRALEGRSHNDLQAAVRAFEEASGVTISVSWDAGRIGSAVRTVLANEQPIMRVRHLPDQLETLARDVRRALERTEREAAE